MLKIIKKIKNIILNKKNIPIHSLMKKNQIEDDIKNICLD